jgi:hypothetical protein
MSCGGWKLNGYERKEREPELFGSREAFEVWRGVLSKVVILAERKRARPNLATTINKGAALHSLINRTAEAASRYKFLCRPQNRNLSLSLFFHPRNSSSISHPSQPINKPHQPHPLHPNNFQISSKWHRKLHPRYISTDSSANVFNADSLLLRLQPLPARHQRARPQLRRRRPARRLPLLAARRRSARRPGRRPTAPTSTRVRHPPSQSDPIQSHELDCFIHCS